MPSPPAGLVRQLCDEDLLAISARFETLYGGRTNRVWKVLDTEGDKVLKLYNSALLNPLFRNDGALEARCLRALEATGFVPRLRAVGHYESDSWVLYDHAPGSPWREGTATVGKLLKRFHRLPLSIDAPSGCNGSDDLARHGARILAACKSERAHQLADLHPQSHVPPLSTRRLIHGDTVAGNILVSEEGLTLIDWQCPAWGDPCEDLALFLSPSMQQLYRGAPLSDAEQMSFLSAYGDTDIVDRYKALRPWYAWRMAAYCLWRSENGAPDYEAGYHLEIKAF